tara:strand:- start:1083 stop:1217 length:135 start_codon:yes stop_codon:yes gene_type:complete
MRFRSNRHGECRNQKNKHCRTETDIRISQVAAMQANPFGILIRG